MFAKPSAVPACHPRPSWRHAALSRCPPHASPTQLSFPTPSVSVFASNYEPMCVLCRCLHIAVSVSASASAFVSVCFARACLCVFVCANWHLHLRAHAHVRLVLSLCLPLCVHLALWMQCA
jgi:hypothetical protein